MDELAPTPAAGGPDALWPALDAALGASGLAGAELLLLLAAGAGALVAFLLASLRAASVRRTLAERASRAEALAESRAASVASLEAALEEAHRRADGTQDRVIALERAKAGLEQGLEAERAAGAERLDAFRTAEARLSDSFQAMSAEALDRNNERFLALARERLEKLQQIAQQDLDQRQEGIDALVKPIRDSLGKVDESLQRVEKERRGDYAALREQLQHVSKSHGELHQQTSQLVQALRTPNARGRWGEVQLRRVVEMAGMLEHCDFVQQTSVTSGESQQRPDLVVQLPGNRHIVIDAKAPLDAYLNSVDADEATRTASLQQHARQVRNHLDALGARAYWESFDATPEFVVMFLPGEPFFAAALTHDPELLERGVDRKVLVAGPTTLIALLKAVAYGWRQEKMAESAQEVSRIGRQLHDRVARLTGHLSVVGQRLDGAVNAYNKTVGTLETRVLVSTRRFQELGAAGGDAIESPRVIDRRARALQPSEVSDAPDAPDAPDALDTEAAQSPPDAPNRPNPPVAPNAPAGEGAEPV